MHYWKWATAMNTARQATENMEYVRRLLEEKQAGFAASVELAVSLSAVRSSGRRKTMELTLRPGRHEIIESKTGARVARGAAGAPGSSPWPVAEAAAGHVDWHQMAALVQRGCPPWLALRILR
jgi:hypothetical protein